MVKHFPISFEESKVKAVEYVGSERKTARLLARVHSKANWNHKALTGVWESLHILARMVRAQITGRYAIPVATLLAAIAALIYFVEPIDMIPDTVPVFGLLDDAAVIAFVVRANIGEVSKFRTWESS